MKYPAPPIVSTPTPHGITPIFATRLALTVRVLVSLALVTSLGCQEANVPTDTTTDTAANTGGEVVASSDGAGSDTNPHPLDDELRINHLQFKGTHNSYHIEPKVPGKYWSYTHAPLNIQLGEQGVRQFELDIYYNKKTDVFEVFHVRILDDVTTCASLKICLGVIDTWSKAHPDHVPIWVWLEPKDTATQVQEWQALKRLDVRIRGLLAENRRISPDDVRGDYDSLREAVKTQGWPTLRQGRGKIVLVLLDNGAIRDAYVANNPKLAGRTLFAEGEADDPWGVVGKIDGPLGKGKALIVQAVKAGRIIRTRADSIDEAWAKDTSRQEAAFASGAQMVSTDYPVEVKVPPGYVVIVPGGDPVRCNPVSAPAVCRQSSLAGVGL